MFLQKLREHARLTLCQVASAYSFIECVLDGICNNGMQLRRRDVLCCCDIVQALARFQLRDKLICGEMKPLGYLICHIRTVLRQELFEYSVLPEFTFPAALMVGREPLLNAISL